MSETTTLVENADIRDIWRADLQAVGCALCGAVHLAADGVLACCPACLSDALEPQPARMRREPPELALSFAVSGEQLACDFADWMRGVWLRPADMQVERLVSRLTRVYLPMWLVDGRVEGVWEAQMGFDYQVESTEEHFAEDAGWTTRRLKETRVRWEPRAGRVTRRYQNLVVPALEPSEEAALVSRLGHYDLTRATSYAPATIASAAVRVPGLQPEEAWPDARAAFDRVAAADCEQASGAQHHDQFSLTAGYDELNWTQLLRPCLVTYYQDDKKRRIPVWINGQSGRVCGLRRASLRKAWRVAGGVGAAAALSFLIGVLLAFLRVNDIASLLMTVGFFLFFVAAAPVVWAWQFNLQSREHCWEPRMMMEGKR